VVNGSKRILFLALLCSGLEIGRVSAAPPRDTPSSSRPTYDPYVLTAEATVKPQSRDAFQLKRAWMTRDSISGREHLDRGFVIVLCGVLGKTEYNGQVVRQLSAAGLAVELYDWTAGVPLPFRRGLNDNHFSEQTARRLKRRILDYRVLYPGRPVYLIGLCAGAGPACEVLRRLDYSDRVERAVLLGPALSPIYNLNPALKGTKDGIDSFHSPLDVPILVGLTTIVGTVDGQHLPAAGAIGFGGSPRLRQHRYGPSMLSQGHWGGHFGWTAREFVRASILPLLRTSE
jgi:hypothetical protein